MSRRTGALRGMTAGLVAAGVMSAVRLMAHRAGLIDRTVPQVLQERAGGVDPSGGDAAHQLAAEAIHLAVSLAAGATLGAITARPRLRTGVVYGLAIWVVEALGLLPALRVRRVAGSAVDAVAHGVFGATVALAMRELTAQPRPAPRPAVMPVRRRVG